MTHQEYIDIVQVGDTFIDPLDGSTREVERKGQLFFGADGYPYWDDSIFTTDGGCVSAEEVWEGITI